MLFLFFVRLVGKLPLIDGPFQLAALVTTLAAVCFLAVQLR